ncbi:MAG: cytochrome c oxidase subunit II [Longimicrobiales bacterium]
MSRHRRVIGRTAGALGAALLVLATAACVGEFPQSTFRPVTDFAREIDDLFTSIFWWTIIVLVVVEVGIVYILVRFRARDGGPDARKIYGDNKLELFWTLIPAVIVVFITVPTVQTIFRTYRDAASSALVVEAIGPQWWWEFRYPELGIVTANQLYLPVGREIDIRLASADVIHNFWIPRLGGKRYNYPVVARPAEDEQRPNYHRLVFTISEPGEYSGQCAEYCGLSHAIMRMNVIAVGPGAFERWTDAMRAGGYAAPSAPQAEAEAEAEAVAVPPPVGTLERQGYDIFTTRACVACHTVNGTPARGQLGPNLTNFGNRWSVGAGALSNELENVMLWIRNPQAIKPGAKMPGTRTEGGGLPPTGLTDEEVRAVATYLLSLK